MSEQSKHPDDTAVRRHRVVIVAPTCFYYQVPLFRELDADSRIDLSVYYCSDEALHGEDVPKKFGTSLPWGDEDDLLRGYKYKFLRNYSPWPSYLNSLVGLLNFGIWREIVTQKPDVVVLMSWMNPTWWLAILACLYARIPFLYLTDQNVQRDLTSPKLKRWIKQLLLGKVLFHLTAGFLCAGTANRLLYRFYGVPESKLIPFAFSWGYDALLGISEDVRKRNKQIRGDLGIPEDSRVVLYCGRLSPEKAIMDLLEAYQRVEMPQKALVIVGDGQLKEPLQRYVAEHNLDSVYFFGFQPRPEIPKYYGMSDVLVLPSNRETWGIVVNEAMCFALPVIVSDQVGAGRDLVESGSNGFSCPSGDIESLAKSINKVLSLSEEQRRAMGANSRERIERWSQRDLTNALVLYLDSLPDRSKKDQDNRQGPHA